MSSSCVNIGSGTDTECAFKPIVISMKMQKNVGQTRAECAEKYHNLKLLFNLFEQPLCFPITLNII